MAIMAFPQPKDLEVSFIDRTGDSRSIDLSVYNVSKPHPGFGKDPNILNEFGHTKYPMWVGNVIVQNKEEELAERAKSEPKSEPEAKQEAPKTNGW